MTLNYTTLEEAKAWLGNKIALYGGANASDSDITDDLAIAEGMVDTYISAQYQTPMTNANAQRLIVGHVKAFFLEQAYCRSDAGEAPAGVQKSIERTIKQLEAIASKQQWLAGIEPDKAEPASASSIIMIDAEPTRDSESLKGF